MLRFRVLDRFRRFAYGTTRLITTRIHDLDAGFAILSTRACCRTVLSQSWKWRTSRRNQRTQTRQASAVHIQMRKKTTTFDPYFCLCCIVYLQSRWSFCSVNDSRIISYLKSVCLSENWRCSLFADFSYFLLKSFFSVDAALTPEGSVIIESSR